MLHDFLGAATVCMFLQIEAEVGGGDGAGENVAHSPTLKPLKAAVLFSIEALN